MRLQAGVGSVTAGRGFRTACAHRRLRMAVPARLQVRRGGALAVGEVEVGEQHVAACVQQDVLRLEVAVHEAHQVQVLQRHQHLPPPTAGSQHRTSCQGGPATSTTAAPALALQACPSHGHAGLPACPHCTRAPGGAGSRRKGAGGQGIMHTRDAEGEGVLPARAPRRCRSGRGSP